MPSLCAALLPLGTTLPHPCGSGGGLSIMTLISLEEGHVTQDGQSQSPNLLVI